ncbi:hypothetical protein [Limosilactobacillus mucosae]|uniref:hypothetical protein n=1 Tax=Limosilactobacillus mucosae TaxID=97478 RepID=UPI00065271EA|nr:hypothetical protein [Limosilactobacillus mucosae]HAM86051.1 hypothetical protein [Lactobacillus sp.]
MMYAKGQYFNGDGVSTEYFYLRIPDDRLSDFQAAGAKVHKKDFMVLAFDQANRLRAVIVKGTPVKVLPKNTRPIGDCFGVLYGSDELPLTRVAMSLLIPKSVKGRKIAELATLYLPKSPHQLPK